MDLFTKQQLNEIIRSGEFNLLKGKYENNWFDCKKEFYDLNSEKGKRELAKDVSSFANAGGGYILIGAKGTPNESHSGEQIIELSLFVEAQVNLDQHRKIIDSWIYPKVENISLLWYPSKNDNNKGLVLIEIPSQREKLKPFLIKNILVIDRTSEIMFGLTQRQGDSSAHFDLREIHRLIQLGQDYDKNISGRFDDIETNFKLFAENFTQTEFHKKKEVQDRKLEERLEGSLIKTQQHKKPTLILSAYIISGSKLKDSNLSDIVSNLKSKTTQPLRDGGWKLLYSTDLITKSHSLIEIGYNSKSLSLFDDGTIVYITNIDQISLIEKENQIIPVALIEIVYHFTNFYKQYLNYFQNSQIIGIDIRLNNLINENSKIILTQDLKPMHHFELHEAPEKSMKEVIEVDKDFNPQILAFQIIEKIYSFFGITELPPYSNNHDGVWEIDTKLLRY